jgi:hypothetical protein
MAKIKLSPGQRTVLQAFADYGDLDDVGLSVYIHHVADKSMSSSGIRTRRCELARLGFVRVVGVKQTKSGRSEAVNGITAKGRLALNRRTVRRARARSAVTA